MNTPWHKWNPIVYPVFPQLTKSIMCTSIPVPVVLGVCIFTPLFNVAPFVKKIRLHGCSLCSLCKFILHRGRKYSAQSQRIMEQSPDASPSNNLLTNCVLQSYWSLFRWLRVNILALPAVYGYKFTESCSLAQWSAVLAVNDYRNEGGEPAWDRHRLQRRVHRNREETSDLRLPFSSAFCRKETFDPPICQVLLL